MTFGSLFSGIGGLDLGLERAGMQCRWQVENNDYANQVLAKHWPEVKRYGDIRQLTAADLEPVDLICGGFPCQDLSLAGKRAGIEGARSGLWFEFARLVGELQPRYVLIENVPGLLIYDAIRRVVGELARLRYVGCWRSLRASEFGASHLRKRVFIVAYSNSERRRETRRLRHETVTMPSGISEAMAHTGGERCIRNTGELQLRQQGTEYRSSNVAYGATGGCSILRKPFGSNGFTNGRHAHLADTGNGQFQIPWWLPQRGDGTRSGSAALADAEFKGLEIRDRQREQQLRQDESFAPGLLPFAPGPSDPRWSAILREQPDLAPALANAISGRNSRRLRGGLHDYGPDGPERQIREPARASVGENEGPGTAPTEPEICRVADGLSDRLDRAMSNRTKRLGRLGNAVVPDCAEWIGRKILEFDRLLTGDQNS